MILESQLFDYMKTTSQAASIKSSESGKYIFSNAANTRLMGFVSPDLLIGLTVRDLNFSRSQQGNTWAEKIQGMDYLSLEKKCAVEDTHEYLNENGILVYKTTTKLPLIGIRGKVFGIVTFSQELTHRLSHRLLYGLYKNIHGKKIAARKFLHHLEIESWFYLPPTEAELLALIERATGKADKDIAQAHGVSIRTIETHFVNLRAKLKGEAMSSIIFRLRNPSHTINVI
jgi:DNA-binding CsgD family transcriptional regulator